MIGSSVPLEIKNNAQLKRVLAEDGETNIAWLQRAAKEGVSLEGSLLLLGGTTMADFRVRISQSHLRFDLTPSYWSLVAVLSGKDTVYTVPLEIKDEISEIPRLNAVQETELSAYDDPERFPNIAVIQLTDTPERVLKYTEAMKLQRGLVDLPALVLSWLAFVWCVGKKGNPLLEGDGLPSAVFAESLFGLAGIELTPGLATASTCPEAMWQAAKWWASFYEDTRTIASPSHAQVIVPKGCFVLRQPDPVIRKREQQGQK